MSFKRSAAARCKWRRWQMMCTSKPYARDTQRGKSACTFFTPVAFSSPVALLAEVSDRPREKNTRKDRSYCTTATVCLCSCYITCCSAHAAVSCPSLFDRRCDDSKYPALSTWQTALRSWSRMMCSSLFNNFTVASFATTACAVRTAPHANICRRTAETLTEDHLLHFLNCHCAAVMTDRRLSIFRFPQFLACHL